MARLQPFFSRSVVSVALLGLLLAGCGNSDQFVFDGGGTTGTGTSGGTGTGSNGTGTGGTATNGTGTSGTGTSGTGTSGTGSTTGGGSAPIAVADSYATRGNIPLEVASAGVLANDTLNGATISDFDATSDEGGAVSLDADGNFTYSPAAGFTGPDTFTYTLSNDAGTSTATVTVAVGDRIWFVDDSAAVGGTGLSDSPFRKLSEAATAADENDIIYVFAGNYNESITLQTGQMLVGAGTAFDTDSLPVLARVNLPAGTEPTIRGPIVLTGDNLVQGIEVLNCPAADGAIQTDLPAATPNIHQNLTVRDTTITNPAGYGIAFVLPQPTVSEPEISTQEIRDVTITSSGDSAVFMDTRKSQNFINIVDNDISDSATSAIEVALSGGFGSDLDLSGNSIAHSGTQAAFLLPIEPVFGVATIKITNNTLTGTATDIDSQNNGASVTFQVEGNSFASASAITLADNINGGLIFTRVVDLADLAASNTGTLTISTPNAENAEELGTAVVQPSM
jgi:hypothetical protein